MYTILIVEDNLIVQTTIKDILLKLKRNINVLVSTKGTEALKIALNKPIDIFIIDINLPDWNGIELSVALRKTYKHTPIIIESSIRDSNIQAEVHDKIENLAFLTKPFTSEKLINKVKNALEIIKESNTKYLKFNRKGISYLVNIRTILYIERIKGKNNINVVIFDEERNLLKKRCIYGISLKEILKQIEDKREFCRCHKSFIINTRQIDHIDYINKLIYLRHSDQDIPLGDAYKQNLL